MNGENPYQSPLADLEPAVDVRGGERADMRAVAVYQQGVLVCILMSPAFLVGMFYVPYGWKLAFALAMSTWGFVTMVFLFSLATKLYGSGIGLLLCLLTWIPYAGLLVLLAVNVKVTNVLRKNGYRVGLLGAKLSDFKT